MSLCAQFHHSNIDFSNLIERVLLLFIVTPRFHTSHHAVDRRYGDANFSTIFSIWDHLFKTYNEHNSFKKLASDNNSIGLPDGRDLFLSPLAWIIEPISNQNLNLNSTNN